MKEESKILQFKKKLEEDLKTFRLSHYILRPYIKNMLSAYHKSITFEGYDDINWEKPIIFVPSHQNAFMDALIVVAYTTYKPERYIYPLIRADVYENKVLKNIVTEYHMIPVFRPRDRREINSANKAVFLLAEDLLVQNYNLFIHAEGSCVPQKSVRSFRKGFARIALNAEQKNDFQLGVQIVPVSINYEFIKERGGHVHLTFHKAVKVAGYRHAFESNAQKTISDVTQTVEDIVRAGNIHLNDVQDVKLAEKCFRIWQNRYDITEGAKIVKTQISIAELMNTFTADQMRYLEIEISRLEKTLENIGLGLDTLRGSHSAGTTLIYQGLLLLITFPLSLWGFLHHLLPVWLADKLVSLKIKEEQFKSSARIIFWLLLIPVNYLAIGAVLFTVNENWVFNLVYLLTLPLVGIIAQHWAKYFRKWGKKIRNHWAFWRHQQARPVVEKQLKNIISVLKKSKSRYISRQPMGN